ncbi:hypothetical protein NN561_014196 [Cricetulus griseus]
MRTAALDAASRTSLGTAGCRLGVRVGGGPPRSSGLELWRFTLFWRCWLRFGEGVGAGRPSAFTPVAGVCVGEAGGGPLGPPSPGDVGSLCNAPLLAPSVPAPPSAPHSHDACLRGSRVARGRCPFFLHGPGALMCIEGQQGSRGA